MGAPSSIFSRVDEIKALGLDVPPMAELARELRDRGLSLFPRHFNRDGYGKGAEKHAMPIQVEHLTHTYMPGSPFSAVALHDVTLTIGDGELIGLLGHTGSGKTTLVQHLNGLIRPTEGRVVVDGLDITEKGVSLLEVRKKVGLVFQYPEYQLFEETVQKDIAFGPKNMGLSADEIDERVRCACAQVGLPFEDICDRSPFELSGGQMRRVAIAGVLAMRPGVLILDEPTAGLDPAGRRSILSMIRDLHAAAASRW